MKIRALRTLRNDVGNIRRGHEAEVSDPDGKSLIARGWAEAVDDPPAPRQRRQAKPASNTAKRASNGKRARKAKAKPVGEQASPEPGVPAPDLVEQASSANGAPAPEGE